MVGAQQAMPQLPPNLPESLTNLLSCCFKQQPAARPSATQLMYELRVCVIVVVVVVAVSFSLAEQNAEGAPFCRLLGSLAPAGCLAKQAAWPKHIMYIQWTSRASKGTTKHSTAQLSYADASAPTRAPQCYHSVTLFPCSTRWVAESLETPTLTTTPLAKGCTAMNPFSCALLCYGPAGLQHFMGRSKPGEPPLQLWRV